MRTPVLEYIKLLDRRPDVIAKLLLDHVKTYDLRDEEELGIVELWRNNPQLAESLFSAYCEHESLGDAALLKLLEFWKNGSDTAGCFLQKYSAQWSLGYRVETELIKGDSLKFGDFLLSYSKRHDFFEDTQVALVELLPNSLAIVLLKAQRSYEESTLLKLLDIWQQYPNEVADIIKNKKALKCMFEDKKVMLKLTNLLETMPEDFGAKEIFEEYLRYDDIGSACYVEVPLALLDYIEKGLEKVSAVAKDLMVLYTKRLPVYDKRFEQKLMKLFKADPAVMYNIVLQALQRSHSEYIGKELVDLWQAGSKEAYNLLTATKLDSKSVASKIFNLWRQGVPDAYELLVAQGNNLFLEDKEQIELAELLGQGSKEAYKLLYAHTHYPGHKLCPEALMKLALCKTPHADEIIKRATRS